MEELNLELLNEIISEVITLDCHSFSNLHESLLEFKDELDPDEMADFLTEHFNIGSEKELDELADYEKKKFLEYIEEI
jgi:hypothetical protein